ncbi:MAG: SirB2 family protein [Gammaproteobacteria bacterium]|nr:SirB2 family protein [Gammaproteobacteria bacterium]
MYLILKNFHMTFAALTITGFLLRGFWVMSGSRLYQNRASRIVPHVIDALFLATGIGLVVTLDLAWMQQPWLLAKFTALFFYIGLGMVAFRFGRTPEIKAVAFVAAVAAFAYIVGVALSKSPLSWIVFL